MDATTGVRPPSALPRELRIQRRSDFLRAYEEGTKIHGKLVVVFVVPNGFGHPRIGVTVTRKLGKAVERNRTKRWTKDTFRQNRRTLGLDRISSDFVVNVKPAAGRATFVEFSEDLRRALRKAAGSQRR